MITRLYMNCTSTRPYSDDHDIARLSHHGMMILYSQYNPEQSTTLIVSPSVYSSSMVNIGHCSEVYLVFGITISTVLTIIWLITANISNR
jgi:hypothetical protein